MLPDVVGYPKSGPVYARMSANGETLLKSSNDRRTDNVEIQNDTPKTNVVPGPPSSRRSLTAVRVESM
jgi:hypothetical protein